jgi:hypothetical protein
MMEDILAFIRSADRDTWHLIAEEIRLTTFNRDVQAAWSFRVGDSVSFNHPDGSHRVNGKVIKIQRNRGRLTVVAELGDRMLEYTLGASMVMGRPELAGESACGWPAPTGLGGVDGEKG